MTNAQTKRLRELYDTWLPTQVARKMLPENDDIGDAENAAWTALRDYWVMKLGAPNDTRRFGWPKLAVHIAETLGAEPLNEDELVA